MTLYKPKPRSTPILQPKQSMTIHFSGSIHGKKKFVDRYTKIVEIIEENGHRVFADHILQVSLDDIQKRHARDDAKYFKKLIESIKRSDALFVELSYPSPSVGFYISQAVSLRKPVVIFYSGTEESHLLRILESISEKIAVVRYSDPIELITEVPLMLDFVAEVQDTRFNFFVSPDIATYLDWVAKERRVPRSVYLRRLIDEDMNGNKPYLESQSVL